VAVTFAGVLFATLSVSGAPANREMRCRSFAAPNGNDHANGSRRSPFRTIARLVAALEPGKAGCLLDGRYIEDVGLESAGRPGKPFVLRAAPAARAAICGKVEFKASAAHWRVIRLEIDGSCSPENTVQIYGDHITLSHDDITNRHHADSCVMIGGAKWGLAYHAVLDHDRIHDCGTKGSDQMHGVYANSPRDARISDNYIYANAGFGIHLYPDAQRTIITRNVVDGNMAESGLVFAGQSSYSSSHNLVLRNIFSRNGLYGVSSSWGSEHVGSANVAEKNCFWRNSAGPTSPNPRGYTALANINANPRFVGADSYDYRVPPNSPCVAMQPRGTVGP
jgi:Right handed beta helix region